MGNFAVSLKRLVEKVSLEVIYTPCDLDKISVEIAEVNRPGLFLAGYYDYFDKLRLQIMGLAEMNFLAGLTAEKRRERPAVPPAASGRHPLPQRGIGTLPGDAGACKAARGSSAALQRDDLHHDGQPHQHAEP